MFKLHKCQCAFGTWTFLLIFPHLTCIRTHLGYRSSLASPLVPIIHSIEPFSKAELQICSCVSLRSDGTRPFQRQEQMVIAVLGVYEAKIETLCREKNSNWNCKWRISQSYPPSRWPHTPLLALSTCMAAHKTSGEAANGASWLPFASCLIRVCHAAKPHYCTVQKLLQ